ncbi:MAG: CBS domain-containing protein [Desulfatiglans sp.]|jgi:tRNA nucleotidyltransferase (CCA-adding enzyme)|nr:CBS domain-containing protein [Desulfatiglans sp.]
MERQDSKNRGQRGSAKISGEIITTHVNADFDALGSMIAARKLYPEATLVFSGSQEKNLRDFFLNSASYLFNFGKLKNVDFERVTRLILVDTRQKSRIGKFSRLIGKKGVEIHIYDHHPDNKDDVHGDLEIVRRSGSNTAIMADLIRERRIPISADEATIMCLGIHEDTGSFTFSSTTPSDYEAAAWLAGQGADHNVISEMLTRELTAEQVWLLNDLIHSAKNLAVNGQDIVIAKVVREEYVGDFAVLVHKFMEMDNLDVVFAMAQMDHRIYLVARSRISEVNVAEIVGALGGGGHPHAASATIKNKTLIQVERSLKALLRNRVDPLKTASEMMSSPVIHIGPDETVKRAARLMTRYNINVLLVMDQHDLLKGYITRQIVEKAVFFNLGEIKVKDYMNIEFSTTGPDVPLKEVQELITRKRLRVLPVVEETKVLGVITRTDLLNILMGDPLIPEFLYNSKNTRAGIRKKNVAIMLKERLHRDVIQIIKNVGNVADMLGYNAYLVGGLVRDIFLKRDNFDVDIVIEGDGIKFAHEFADHHEVRVRSHRKFGTAVLIFADGFKVDVATARVEYYETPGAPPIVETGSLKLDLYRRDFTINTLAVKLNKRHYGTLIDYFDGQRDIKEKVLRVLHNLSFVEDFTRVLRAIRFEQRFGFKIGKLTLLLIKNAVKINASKEFSSPRFFLELTAILKEEDPLKAIERMNEFDLLQFVSSEINFTPRLQGLLEEVRRVIAWYNLLYLEERFDPWKVYFYGLTSSMGPSSFNSLIPKLGMTDSEARRMTNQRESANTLSDVLYRFDADNFHLYTLLAPYDTETLLYIMARVGNEKAKRLISTFFTKLKGVKSQLSGKDLISLGLMPGPVFKEVFDRLLEVKLNGLTKTREDELLYVKETFLN